MDAIVGQERAVGQLQAALQSGRAHHAYVFHGAVGVGKFTTALAFAKILLCHEAQADLAGQVIACDGCESCRFFSQSQHEARAAEASIEQQAGLDVPGAAHPDLHIVVKELSLFSQDAAVRARKLMNIPRQVLADHLIAPAHRSPLLRHNKVLIADEAELMDATGQNLLLKTLEEPPAGTYIILVTSSEDRLLPTIRSRCHRVGFGLLPDDTVRQRAEQWQAQALEAIADRLAELEAEKKLSKAKKEELAQLQSRQRSLSQMSDADWNWLIYFAHGSLGVARLVIEYDMLAWYRRVLPSVDQMARRQFDPQLGADMKSLADGFATEWVAQRKNASKDAANKFAVGLMLTLITRHAQHRLSKLADRCDPADPDAGDRLLEPWIGVIDAAERAQRELFSNVNQALVMDHLAAGIYQSLTGQANALAVE